MRSSRPFAALHHFLFALRREIAPQVAGNAVGKNEGKEDDGGGFYNLHVKSVFGLSVIKGLLLPASTI